MRALVVDDDPISLKMMKENVSSICDCNAMGKGETVVPAFEKAWSDWSPYDLILLDIQMPVTNGMEVLREIRKMEDSKKVPDDKKVKILMVTSKSDKETIIKCIKNGCNDYMTKPFDRDIMLNKIKKMGISFGNGKEDKVELLKNEKKMDLKEAIKEVIQQFKGGDIDLPVLSQVVQDVKRVLSVATSTVNDLAQVIGRDATISIKLIATANSPLYRGTEKISTVDKAISRVGDKETQSIVTVIANKSLYEIKNVAFKEQMEKLWLHSLCCAYSAKALAKRLRMNDGEKFFMMGLLHDIGKVFLFRRLGEIFRKDTNINIAGIYRNIKGVDSKFSGALLKRWGFDEDFIRVAMEHETKALNQRSEKDTILINLAHNLSVRLGYNLLEREVEEADFSAGELLNIDLNTIGAISERVRVIMMDSASVF